MKNKKIYIRENGKTSKINNEDENNIIGWFSNKYNIAEGWSICELDQNDKEWLKSQNIELKNIFRITSEKNTTIALFDFEKYKVAFFDNNFYLKTDKIKFEKFYTWDRLFFDNIKIYSKYIHGY